VHTRRIDDAPTEHRGGGQVSHLLLAPGEFGARNLAVTWVECAPGSQQDLHAHPDSEQVYVIIAGRGRMIVGEERSEVSRGAAIFIPPRTDHAIRALGDELLVYVSATSPPFGAEVDAGQWRAVETERSAELG
jgi:mannose-6-phosphate isomerase-like protein (cupin superfamily)